MAKILVTHGVPDAYKELLEGHEVIAPEPLEAFTAKEVYLYAEGADAIMACGALDADAINHAKKLKIIANYGAGYDRVDVAAATKRGIYVTNTPDETAYPTAEVAIGLLLDCARRIGQLNNMVRHNAPETLFGMGKHMGIGLFGNTLGIIGMGHIGGIVAQFGSLMGMKVLYYNRHKAKEEFGATYTELDTLLNKSDMVSVHCPLTSETNGLISKQKLALMKKRAVLVNTARGAVVDYKALYERLQSEPKFFAGLDVFPDEPHIDAALISCDNCVITPHIGTNTLEARNAMGCAAASRILEVLGGQTPSHIVNL